MKKNQYAAKRFKKLIEEQLMEFKSGVEMEEKEFIVDDYINPDVEEVVINQCYGGFGLSDEASVLLSSLVGGKPDNDPPDVERNNKNLVAVVKALGAKANGSYAALRIVELEKGCKWYITEYDGIETIEFKQQMWLITHHGKSAVVIADSPSEALKKVSFPDTAAVTSIDDGYLII